MDASEASEVIDCGGLGTLSLSPQPDASRGELDTNEMTPFKGVCLCRGPSRLGLETVGRAFCFLRFGESSMAPLGLSTGLYVL